MNRSDRRRVARNAAKRLGLHGAERQEAIRALASSLLQNPLQPNEPEEVVGGTQDAAVSRRKSGLYAVRMRSKWNSIQKPSR